MWRYFLTLFSLSIFYLQASEEHSVVPTLKNLCTTYLAQATKKDKILPLAKLKDLPPELRTNVIIAQTGSTAAALMLTVKENFTEYFSELYKESSQDPLSVIYDDHEHGKKTITREEYSLNKLYASLQDLKKGARSTRQDLSRYKTVPGYLTHPWIALAVCSQENHRFMFDAREITPQIVTMIEKLDTIEQSRNNISSSLNVVKNCSKLCTDSYKHQLKKAHAKQEILPLQHLLKAIEDDVLNINKKFDALSSTALKEIGDQRVITKHITTLHNDEHYALSIEEIIGVGKVVEENPLLEALKRNHFDIADILFKDALTKYTPHELRKTLQSFFLKGLVLSPECCEWIIKKLAHALEEN